MRFSYNKLWKLLIDKNMNKQTLKKISNIMEIVPDEKEAKKTEVAVHG